MRSADHMQRRRQRPSFQNTRTDRAQVHPAHEHPVRDLAYWLRTGCISTGHKRPRPRANPVRSNHDVASERRAILKKSGANLWILRVCQ